MVDWRVSCHLPEFTRALVGRGRHLQICSVSQSWSVARALKRCLRSAGLLTTAAHGGVLSAWSVAAVY